jgi:hypothetical protein
LAGLKLSGTELRHSCWRLPGKGCVKIFAALAKWRVPPAGPSGILAQREGKLGSYIDTAAGAICLGKNIRDELLSMGQVSITSGDVPSVSRRYNANARKADRGKFAPQSP